MMSLIQLARDMVNEHILQVLVKLKKYYDQHSKEHSFQMVHQFWIYSPAVKIGLTKKLACLCLNGLD